LQRIISRPTETSSVDFGIFRDRNFGLSNLYEVSIEVSVERKPEKFWVKINYCAGHQNDPKNFGSFFHDLWLLSVKNMFKAKEF
jgi:hypothetical protein